MNGYLIEFESNPWSSEKIFHINKFAEPESDIIKDLLRKKYKMVKKFSWKYMCKHTYFVLDCGVILDISYANDTEWRLINDDMSEYKFKFDLNPFND